MHAWRSVREGACVGCWGAADASCMACMPWWRPSVHQSCMTRAIMEQPPTRVVFRSSRRYPAVAVIAVLGVRSQQLPALGVVG